MRRGRVDASRTLRSCLWLVTELIFFSKAGVLFTLWGHLPAGDTSAGWKLQLAYEKDSP